MTLTQQVVVVFGSTGEQGGSVLAALRGHFKIRAVTRNAASPSAQVLAALGSDVEVVTADATDPVSLRAAMAGAYGVFAMTNFWDPSTNGKEFEVGAAMADVAKEAGVQVYVWAGLPDVDKLTDGKHPMPHFSGKARVWEHVKSLGFPAAASVEGAFFFSTFEKFSDFLSMIMGPKLMPDGHIDFLMPIFTGSDKMAAFDPREIGKAVLPIMLNPEKFNGKRIRFTNVYDQPLSRWMADLEAFAHRPVRLVHVPYEAAKEHHAYGADIFLGQKEHGYYPHETGPDLVEGSDIVATPLSTWPQFLEASVWAQQFVAAGHKE